MGEIEKLYKALKENGIDCIADYAPIYDPLTEASTMYITFYLKSGAKYHARGTDEDGDRLSIRRLDKPFAVENGIAIDAAIDITAEDAVRLIANAK